MKVGWSTKPLAEADPAVCAQRAEGGCRALCKSPDYAAVLGMGFCFGKDNATMVQAEGTPSDIFISVQNQGAAPRFLEVRTLNWDVYGASGKALNKTQELLKLETQLVGSFELPASHIGILQYEGASVILLVAVYEGEGEARKLVSIRALIAA